MWRLLVAVMLLSCTSCISLKSKRNIVKSCTVRSLPWFSHGIISVNCDDIKNRSYRSLKIKYLTASDSLDSLFSILNNPSNYVFYPRKSQTIDTKVRLDFFLRNGTKKHFCISRTGLIQKDDKVYEYNNRVRDILLSNRLIIYLKSGENGGD